MTFASALAAASRTLTQVKGEACAYRGARARAWTEGALTARLSRLESSLIYDGQRGAESHREIAHLHCDPDQPALGLDWWVRVADGTIYEIDGIQVLPSGTVRYAMRRVEEPRAGSDRGRTV